MTPPLSCPLEGDIHTFLLIHPALAAPGWIRIPTPGAEPNQEGPVRPHIQRATPPSPQSVVGIQEDFSRVLLPEAKSISERASSEPPTLPREQRFYNSIKY